MDAIKGNLNTILEGAKQFIIPVYQRVYSWGTEQCQKLCNIAKINPLLYRGYYYDSELGLYYLNARYYDPETGRFLNADNNLEGGLNIYAYCYNNPINLNDPTGHWGFGTHYKLGYEAAISEGYSEKQAAEIAHACMMTDVWYFDLFGIFGWFKTQSGVHFNMNENAEVNSSEDTRNVFMDEQIEKAKNDSSKANAREHFGYGLHAIQDIYAHNHVTDMKQHDAYRYEGKNKGEGRVITKLIDDPDYDITWATGKVEKAVKNNPESRYNKAYAATKKYLSNYKDYLI